MDILDNSFSVNSSIDKDFIVSLLVKDLCSRLHDWHKNIDVGNETHSTVELLHSRHLSFPGNDKRLLIFSSESVVII